MILITTIVHLVNSINIQDTFYETTIYARFTDNL